MSKSKEKLIARKLRIKGVSVKEIAKQLHLSKSTVSLWVRDIILNIEQLEKLNHRRIEGAERGRMLGALKQKKIRLMRIKRGIVEGKSILSRLNKREFLIAGIALYWAEGTKKKREIAFCNSDPKMIQFMINWLKCNFNIPTERLSCYVGINKIHKKREKIVKNYWSKMSGIPISQFTKTSLKKVKNKKIYANFNTHYGTLTIKVKSSSQYYYDIIGLIEGLYYRHIARVAQW